jgi:hypothetical protein
MDSHQKTEWRKDADDLAMALVHPKKSVEILKSKYKFKLKGTGPMSESWRLQLLIVLATVHKDS